VAVTARSGLRRGQIRSGEAISAVSAAFFFLPPCSGRPICDTVSIAVLSYFSRVIFPPTSHRPTVEQGDPLFSPFLSFLDFAQPLSVQQPVRNCPSWERSIHGAFSLLPFSPFHNHILQPSQHKRDAKLALEALVASLFSAADAQPFPFAQYRPFPLSPFFFSFFSFRLMADRSGNDNILSLPRGFFSTDRLIRWRGKLSSLLFLFPVEATVHNSCMQSLGQRIFVQGSLSSPPFPSLPGFRGSRQ